MPHTLCDSNIDGVKGQHSDIKSRALPCLAGKAAVNAILPSVSPTKAERPKRSTDSWELVVGGSGICGDARHAGAHGGQGRAARHCALGTGAALPCHTAAAQVRHWCTSMCVDAYVPAERIDKQGALTNGVKA